MTTNVTVEIATEADPLGTAIETWTDEDLLDLKLDISLFDLGKNSLTIPRALWEASSLKPYGDGAYYARVNIPYIHSGPNPYWAFWLVSGEFILVDPQETGGETITIGGPGPLWYFTKARLNWTEYTPHADTYVKDGTWHFVDKTYGQILSILVNEDAASPRQALTALDTPGWSNSVDVDGNPWSEFGGIYSVDVGTDYLSIIRDLQKADELFVWMTPGLDLRAFQSYGRDLTGGAFGSGVVRFERGSNILGQLRRQNEKGQAYSHVLALGNDKRVDGEVIEGLPIHAWEEAPGFTPGDPIRQGFLTYNTNSDTILRRAAQRYIRRSRDRAERLVRCEVMPGQSEANGLYLPGDGSTDRGNFWIGDTVTFDTGAGNDLDLNETELQIAKIELQLAEASRDDTNQAKERSWRVFIETGDDVSPGPTADTSLNTGSKAGARCFCPRPCDAGTSTTQVVTTGTDWKVHSGTAPVGWHAVGYDDSAEPDAVNPTTYPTWYDVSSGRWIWDTTGTVADEAEIAARIEFEITDIPAEASLTWAVDNGGEIYINGVLYDTLNSRYSNTPYSTFTNAHTVSVDPSDLVVGTNVISVAAWNGEDVTGPNPAGVYAVLTIDATDLSLQGTENTYARCDHGHLHASLPDRNSEGAHGASSIEVADADGNFTADNVEDALAELATGGGGGGHDITEDGGTALTTRGNLDFRHGLDVTDDSGSDSTRVAVDESELDSSLIPITDAGGFFSSTDIEGALQEVGTLTGGGALFAIPQFSRAVSNFSSSSTSLVLTMPSAPAAGENLVLVVGSGNNRAPSGVSQTNVTWTQRYSGSGNNQFVTIWTGAVSASAGTGITISFGSSGTQQATAFVVDGVTPFTAGTVLGTDTGTDTIVTISSNSATAGGYYIGAMSQTTAAFSTTVVNQPWSAPEPFGGQERCAIWRQNGANMVFTSNGNVGGAHFAAVVKMT